MSPTTRKIVIGGGAAVLLGVSATGVAGAAGSGSGAETTDAPNSGSALARASEAALAETGSGSVVDSEVEAEENGYEVEVDLPDGRQVEVQLDAHFAVVGSSQNHEGDDAGAD